MGFGQYVSRSCNNFVFSPVPSLLKTYKKIHRFMDVIEYFSMRQWEFQMDNMNGVWKALTPRDQELFNFDMAKLDWDNFLHHYYRGIRQYLLKDPMDTIPEASARWKRYVDVFEIVVNGY